MSTVKYTRDHEWLQRAADDTVTLGITDYAQEQLGDIVYVDLPAVGSHIDASANLVVIESVKAVGEVKLSATGTVVAVNERLADVPELVNSAAESDGWLVRVKLDQLSALDDLLDAAAYQAFLATL